MESGILYLSINHNPFFFTDADTSENQNVSRGTNVDSQSNGNKNSFTTVLEGSSSHNENEEQSESNCDKIINKKTFDGNEQTSIISNETTSAVSNRIPKSEGATSDSNNQMNDITVIAELDSAASTEIKHEDSCHSPKAPQSSHSINKIQVSYAKIK